MQQKNTTVEKGADPRKYEIGQLLRYVGPDGDEAVVPTFKAGDVLRVFIWNGCGMGIDAVRLTDGHLDMVWPTEVEVI